MFYSFEHQFGKIRYIVEATYNILRGFDKSYIEIFYVTPELDLTQFTDLQRPIKALKEISFGFNCCFNCLSEPLHLMMFLPKKGFVPGETIPVTIEIDNNSNTRINFIKVELIEKLTFVATIPRVVKETKKAILETRELDAVVAPYQNKIFRTGIYLDPDFDWKIFVGSALFYCDYIIRTEAIRVQSVGLSKNPSVDTNILIGTIPVLEQIAENGTRMNNYNQLPLYHEVSSYLPTFEESVRN